MNLTPLKAIRRNCLYCCNGQAPEVRLCPVEACPVHSLRFGKRIKSISPLKAIRKKCLDCGEGTYTDVKNCIFTDCTLHPYRFGKNPSLKGKVSGKPFPKKNTTLLRENPKNKGIPTIGSNEVTQWT